MKRGIWKWGLCVLAVLFLASCSSGGESPEYQIGQVIQGFSSAWIDGDIQKMRGYLSKEARKNSGMALGFATEFRPQSVSFSSVSVIDNTVTVSLTLNAVKNILGGLHDVDVTWILKNENGSWKIYDWGQK